ncbi:uncharacterized protein LOC122721909 [Manihot esculenta]|uniref:uncharacterized protein LOC122721909 n=1 Tax=Manihot esculenta TaxID=3983 RepID=UPI001CC5E889|nr:uncharacterized protein LOC122721909 [Manihot esculenta]
MAFDTKKAEMQGASQSVKSDPSEWEGTDTFPPVLPGVQSGRAGSGDTARDLGRSVEVNRGGIVQRRDIGVQVNMDEDNMGESEDDAQIKESKSSSSGEVDPSSLSTAAKRGREGRRTPRQWGRTRKGRLWKRLQARLDVGEGLDRPRCLRCGRSHGGVCLAGTTACFSCGQEGHFARECPTAPRMRKVARNGVQDGSEVGFREDRVGCLEV